MRICSWWKCSWNSHRAIVSESSSTPKSIEISGHIAKNISFRITDYVKWSQTKQQPKQSETNDRVRLSISLCSICLIYPFGDNTSNDFDYFLSHCNDFTLSSSLLMFVPIESRSFAKLSNWIGGSRSFDLLALADSALANTFYADSSIFNTPKLFIYCNISSFIPWYL